MNTTDDNQNEKSPIGFFKYAVLPGAFFGITLFTFNAITDGDTEIIHAIFWNISGLIFGFAIWITQRRIYQKNKKK